MPAASPRRRIAKAAVERADFMMIVAGDPPDFRTIAEFRKRHVYTNQSYRSYAQKRHFVVTMNNTHLLTTRVA